MDRLEHLFEHVLWQARWAVLPAVFCSGIAAMMIFYITALDAYHIMMLLSDYLFITETGVREAVRADAVGHIVQVVDGFLLAIVLMIFTFGIYELYVSKIDIAYQDESARHMLSISSLDDLKSRLGKVILMVMIVKFFELAIDMEYSDVWDMIYFAIGILLISLSLYVTEAMLKSGSPTAPVWNGVDRRGERKE
jgi:uncharacterized membrane protein YqhA